MKNYIKAYLTSYKKKKWSIGASLVEYGLLIALIAVVAIPAIRSFGITNACKMCAASICRNYPTAGLCDSFTNNCISSTAYRQAFNC